MEVAEYSCNGQDEDLLAKMPKPTMSLVLKYSSVVCCCCFVGIRMTNSRAIFLHKNHIPYTLPKVYNLMIFSIFY